MVRHMVRAVVKSGHWHEFVAADKAWQEAATRVGLPTYQTYSTNWGTFNETFSLAEYESSADIEARFATADKDPAYDAALAA